MDRANPPKRSDAAVHQWHLHAQLPDRHMAEFRKRLQKQPH
jgi:hypothetical protein